MKNGKVLLKIYTEAKISAALNVNRFKVKYITFLLSKHSEKIFLHDSFHIRGTLRKSVK